MLHARDLAAPCRLRPSGCGYSLEDYLALLELARNRTHLCLQGWDDTRLDDLVPCDGHQVSCGWVAYPLLEHFAQHAGQIALLQSLFQS